jgi:hypothetical protein
VELFFNFTIFFNFYFIIIYFLRKKVEYCRNILRTAIGVVAAHTTAAPPTPNPTKAHTCSAAPSLAVCTLCVFCPQVFEAEYSTVLLTAHPSRVACCQGIWMVRSQTVVGYITWNPVCVVHTAV